MEAVANRGGQTDWLRALAKASIDGPEGVPSEIELPGMGSLALGPEAQKAKLEALALLKSMQARIGEAPKGMSLPMLSYIEGSLKALSDNGPDRLKPLQIAALYMAEKTAQIARDAGLPEPTPSAWPKTKAELEAHAKKEFDRKMEQAMEPKPGSELSEEAKLVQGLEKRLGGPLPKGLDPHQIQQLDASIKKLDEKGPESLSPKESAALFIAPKGAEIAAKAGFQKPVNESGEMQAQHALSGAESVALKKASQFNQEVGVEIARGVSFGDDESYADRMAKQLMQSKAIEQALSGSSSKGLEAIGEKIRSIHAIEEANAIDAKAGVLRKPDAPSPFAKQE